MQSGARAEGDEAARSRVAAVARSIALAVRAAQSVVRDVGVARSIARAVPAMIRALLLAALTGLVVATPAVAAPEDDYRTGRQAYQAGDVVSAMRALRAAADAGHAKAQGLLAFILDRSGSADEALRWYERAAAQGEPEAELALAQIEAVRGGRDAEARALLVRAAGRDHGPAIEALADAYLKQTFGLTKATRDDAQAAAAIRRAADRDYLPAVQGLAAAYREGAFGLAADDAEAARWQARAEQLRKQRAAAGKKSTTEKK